MEKSNSNEDFLNNFLKPEGKAVEKKKSRRGGRGSKTEKKLRDITQRFESEIRKYEEELKKISDSLSKHRQPFKGKPQLKKCKTGKMDKIKKKSADDQHFQYFENNKPEIYQKKFKNEKKNHQYKNVVENMSRMNINTKKKIQLSKEDDKENNYSFPKSIKRNKINEVLSSQIETNTYITGTIRINNKYTRYAYVSLDEKNTEDIIIEGFRDRNRAMEKDLVVVKIKPKEKWTEKDNGTYQKTGVVVCILEKVHPRKAIGTLELNEERIIFRPRDAKFPILTIDPEKLPEEYKSQDDRKNILFMAKIKNWSAPNFCTGIILHAIGTESDLDVQTEIILLENGLDVTPYEDYLLEDLPKPDYKLTANDFKNREDWRDQCIFTIDPATAVDLDDAVSCKKLENGNYEIGVHIADVTHFLKEFSPLDDKVSKRATTVYLTNTVYHMLPKSLCQLCSLLPGQDKLGFSVIWEMTPDARIISHRFTKTVMNSCCQMSYQDAQKMIEEPDLTNWTDLNEMEKKLNIQNGYTISDLSKIVNDLFSISKKLKNSRFEGGALRIDQPKLYVSLDKVTKLPVDYHLEERQESNSLIEEFMLLANMTVATHLYKEFPETAFLRHHNPPKEVNLARLLQSLRSYGIHLNTNSAGGLQASMEKYRPAGENNKEASDEVFIGNCRMMVITSLCAQSMMRANYICAGSTEEKGQLRHYALNVPLYTHFTSPIRRYADCIVHRLLLATLTGDPLPDDWSAELCTKWARNCNRMKDSAKKAQEQSTELYFTQLVAQNGPTEVLGMVMFVGKHNVDVILCHIGITVKVELSDIKNDATVEYENDNSRLNVYWKESGINQVVNIFTIVYVNIRKHPKNYSLRATLLPPKFSYIQQE